MIRLFHRALELLIVLVIPALVAYWFVISLEEFIRKTVYTQVKGWAVGWTQYVVQM